jgi:hypothetical protein
MEYFYDIKTEIWRIIVRTVIYTIIFLFVVQFAFPYAIPLDTVYHNRIDYNLGKDNINDIDVTLDKIKKEIKQEKLKNYGIILGDSVLYGSPGNSDQAVNVFMEEDVKRLTGDPDYRIFNLSFPAMQNGDLYTMLLKLDRLGISTDHLILNARYASFVARNPNPPVVFWLKDDISKLDRDSYNKILPQLQSNGYIQPSTFYEKTKNWLDEDVMPSITPYAYRDYFMKVIDRTKLSLMNKPVPDDALGDIRTWDQKGNLKKYVESDEIRSSFSDKPLNLTPSSYDVYFMDKIIEHQKGKKTLILLTGTNQTLVKSYVEKPGYQANLADLDQYFQSKPTIQYLNLEKAIPDSLFTDHTHLVPDGYRQLAQILVNHYPQ